MAICAFHSRTSTTKKEILLRETTSYMHSYLLCKYWFIPQLKRQSMPIANSIQSSCWRIPRNYFKYYRDSDEKYFVTSIDYYATTVLDQVSNLTRWKSPPILPNILIIWTIVTILDNCVKEDLPIENFFGQVFNRIYFLHTRFDKVCCKTFIVT